MSSIPLPALQIRPPQQQENPLENYARIVGLRSALLNQQFLGGQVQQQQLSLQDDQKWRSIMQSPDWDGTPEQLLKMGLKAGVGPKSYQEMSQHVLDFRQKTATLDATTLKNQQEQNDQYRGRLLSIVNGPEDEKQAQWEKEVTAEEQAGTIKPGAITHTYPGDDHAQAFANHFAMGSVLAKEAIEKQASAAREMGAKFKVVNGVLYDVSGKTPTPAMVQGLNPDQWAGLVDSVVPPQGANQPLNARTKAEVNFYLQQGNLEAAQKAVTAAGAQIGAIEKETSPAVISARVGQAVATEVGKAKALAPTLEQITKTTMSGRKYVDISEVTGPEGQYVRQQALAAGVPVVDKDTASTLAEIDTARANQQSMLGIIGNKLAADPSGRLFTAPANTIQKLAQTDPDMAAVGTFRNAAIQSMRAVAGSKGLRINRYEVQLAIDNDIPKLTDTLPTAQAKLRNIQTFLDNSERAHLVQNRQAGAGGGVQVTDPRGGVHTFPDQQSADAFKKVAGIP